MVCKKCGSPYSQLESRGFRRGLFCCECGTLVKWVTKEELREYSKGIPIPKPNLFGRRGK